MLLQAWWFKLPGTYNRIVNWWPQTKALSAAKAFTQFDITKFILKGDKVTTAPLHSETQSIVWQRRNTPQTTLCLKASVNTLKSSHSLPAVT